MNIPLPLKTNTKHNSTNIKTKRRWVVVQLILLSVFLLYIGMIIGANVSNQSPTPTSQAPTTEQSPDPYQLWLLTNKDRQTADLAPLTLNPYLEASAQAKCADMVTQHYFGHANPQGLMSRDFIGKFVSITRNSTDENLAEGYNSSQATETAWLASPIHREGIMNVHYTDVGFSVCTDDHQFLVVAHFIGD